MSGQSPMVRAVTEAIRRALLDEGRLDQAVLALGGMSGRKYRLFINNLIGALHEPRYLEVGVWAGSTLCAAIDQNEVTALAIDNWSEFGGPSDRFFANLARFKHRGARVSFLERDFHSVDFRVVGRYNVYLYDGPHSVEDQRRGIVLAQPALDSQYVQIVDDWNWEQVRTGTLAGIRDAGLAIDHQVEIRTTLDNSHGEPPGEHGDWHNGYFIAVLSRRS